MQFASSNAGSSNEESVRHLMAMIQNEPVLRQVLRLAQNHCLSGGLHLRFGHHSDVPPTPLFARHIEHYYVQFCRNAIVSFLAVGFTPYRIRRLRGGIQIPEVLPLGTYSWYVTRNTTPLQPTPWRSCAPPPTTAATTTTTTTSTAEEEEDRPLLRIEVASAYTSKERVHVYEFEPLNSLFACSSLLMSLLPGYLRLLHKRECVRRADHFNSHCSLVLEQVERRDMHATQNSNEIVLNMGNEARDLLRSAHAQGEGRQALLRKLLEAQLPDEGVALVAPVNQAVHGLDRVLSPQEMVREELLFMRSVACAVGVPPTLVLQGSGAVGSNSASTSSNAQGWAESSESNNRELLDLCRNMNAHLELLLLEAYQHIYGPNGGPRFRIVALPIFNLEQLQAVFRNELIDDGAFSAILEASWGTPLGKNALGARAEQRKAEYVLPFRDRKQPTPAAKK